MDPQLASVSDVLEQTNQRLTGGEPTERIWPTGFPLLDTIMAGGMRSGSLTVISGAQGLGKTTFALQVARNAVVAGRSALYFSFEHDPKDMLERLIALEAGEISEYDAPDLARIRQVVEGVDGGHGSLQERLSATEAGLEAVRRVQGYAKRLHIHRSTGSSTTLFVIADAVEEAWAETGSAPLVVIDYLQKVRPSDPTQLEQERVTRIVESLKDLAIDAGVPVVAIVAADRDGIEAGRRTRAQHMRGSTALAYEPDTLLLLNDKFDTVARHHLVYDASSIERFRDWLIISVEKNRAGRDGVDIEFRKRFDQGRLETDGRYVTEKLIDERVYTE